MTKTFVPRLSALMAAVALAATAHAGGGEALDIELPSMRTPVTMEPQQAAPQAQISHTQTLSQTQSQSQPQVQAASALYAPMLSPALSVRKVVLVSPSRAASKNATLTRAEVREALRTARASNTMSKDGELGDTDEVLTAREEFNALQTEVLLAEAAAAQAEQVAQQERELAELMAQRQEDQKEDQKQDPEVERTMTAYTPENLLQVASDEELPVLVLLFEEEE